MNAKEPESTAQIVSAAPFVAANGWRYVKDLPTPPEVAEAVKVCGKEKGKCGETRQELEERFKLEYFYSGKIVAYLHTAQGIAVVATDDLPQEEYDAAKATLTPAERAKLIVFGVPEWNVARIGLLESIE